MHDHYVYLPGKKEETQLLNMVEENKKLYTHKQCKRALKARQLLHSLGVPTIKNMKFIIQNNMIKDCPITEEDLKIACNIYGKDVLTLKGKSTRSRPTPVVTDYVAIPKKLLQIHQYVHLFMDIMYVNGMAFLTSTS